MSVKEKPFVSSSVSLKATEWNLLQWKQFLAPFIPIQGQEFTDQKDQRNVCDVGEIHHIHVIAVPLEMQSATDVVR